MIAVKNKFFDLYDQKPEFPQISYETSGPSDTSYVLRHALWSMESEALWDRSLYTET